MNRNKLLIALGGATGSGKTGLALKLVSQYPELVLLSADSRQIYKKLDVGSAKVGVSGFDGTLTGVPEPVWRAHGVSQFLIDIAEPGSTYSLSQYQQEAYRLVRACWDQGKVPFLVGGTGLYLQACVEGYVFDGGQNKEVRSRLESWPVTVLQHKLRAVGAQVVPSDFQNKRRLIRAIERAVEVKEIQPAKPITSQSHVFVLERPWEEQRLLAPDMVQERLDLGLVDETNQLLQSGLDKEWLKNMGLSYRLVIRMLDGEFAENMLKEKMINEFRQLMRRQRTWFNRMPKSEKGSSEEIGRRVAQLLAKNAS